MFDDVPAKPERPNYDPTQPLWSIMTKSRGGNVSVIRDLTLAEVARTYERLDPWYGMTDTQYSVHKDFLSEGCLAMSSGGGWRTCEDGDIEVREVFGPPGWQPFDGMVITYWPKHHTIWTDDKGNSLPDDYAKDTWKWPEKGPVPVSVPLQIRQVSQTHSTLVDGEWVEDGELMKRRSGQRVSRPSSRANSSPDIGAAILAFGCAFIAALIALFLLGR